MGRWNGEGDWERTVYTIMITNFVCVFFYSFLFHRMDWFGIWIFGHKQLILYVLLGFYFILFYSWSGIGIGWLIFLEVHFLDSGIWGFGDGEEWRVRDLIDGWDGPCKVEWAD